MFIAVLSKSPPPWRYRFKKARNYGVQPLGKGGVDFFFQPWREGRAGRNESLLLVGGAGWATVATRERKLDRRPTAVPFEF